MMFDSKESKYFNFCNLFKEIESHEFCIIDFESACAITGKRSHKYHDIYRRTLFSL
jgi:hypothetical protein